MDFILVLLGFLSGVFVLPVIFWGRARLSRPTRNKRIPAIPIPFDMVTSTQDRSIPPRTSFRWWSARSIPSEMPFLWVALGGCVFAILGFGALLATVLIL